MGSSLAFRVSKVILVSKARDEVADVNLTIGCLTENRQHQGFIIRDRHFLSPMASLNCDYGLAGISQPVNACASDFQVAAILAQAARQLRRYRAIDGCAADAQALGNRRWSQAFLLELANLGWIDAALATFVDAARLGFLDTFHLALAAKVGLKLREHAEHVEKRLSRSRAGVDGLFGCFEEGTLGFQRRHDRLQVTDRTRQAVDAGDYEGVAIAHELQEGGERKIGRA